MSSQAGLVTHNVADMRAEPNGRSERVSQAIMGDPVTILEEAEGYARVKTADEYEGWILRRHLLVLDASAPPELQGWPFGNDPEAAHYIINSLTDLNAKPGEPQTMLTKLVIGTWVRKIGKVDTSSGTYLQVIVPASDGLLTGYVDEWDTLQQCEQEYDTDFAPAVANGVNLAWVLSRRFVGTPYLWGGTTPFGFDCSGFVQRIYSIQNVLIPRDAHIQAKSPLGTILPAGEPMTAGDLVFFCGKDDPRQRGITHVGMALDAETMIHASGDDGVAIHALTDPLITGKYTTYGVWRLKEAEALT